MKAIVIILYKRHISHRTKEGRAEIKIKKAVGDQYFNRYENLQIRCGFVEACGGSGIEQGTALSLEP